MDDADMRRSPSLHRVFGESVALMASYALIAEGYALIGRNSEKPEEPGLLRLALENAAKNTVRSARPAVSFSTCFPPISMRKP